MAPAWAGALFWRCQAIPKQHFFASFLRSHLESGFRVTLCGFGHLLGIPFGSQVVPFSAFIFKLMFETLKKTTLCKTGAGFAGSRGMTRSPGGMCGAGLGGYRGLRILQNVASASHTLTPLSVNSEGWRIESPWGGRTLPPLDFCSLLCGQGVPPWH